MLNSPEFGNSYPPHEVMGINGMSSLTIKGIDLLAQENRINYRLLNMGTHNLPWPFVQTSVRASYDAPTQGLIVAGELTLNKSVVNEANVDVARSLIIAAAKSQGIKSGDVASGNFNSRLPCDIQLLSPTNWDYLKNVNFVTPSKPAEGKLSLTGSITPADLSKAPQERQEFLEEFLDKYLLLLNTAAGLYIDQSTGTSKMLWRSVDLWSEIIVQLFPGSQYPETVYSKAFNIPVRPKLTDYVPGVTAEHILLGSSEVTTVPDGVIVQDPKYTLDDVGGMPHVKELIGELLAAHTRPDLVQKWKILEPVKGVLLYGDPGTGKTMLAHGIARSMSAKLWIINSGTIFKGESLGQANNRLNAIFDALESTNEPVVVLLDEIDGAFGKINGADTGGGATQERKDVAANLKLRFDQIDATNDNVLIVATTNDPELIDPSILRSERFDYRIFVPRPDDAGRKQIIGKLLFSLHDSVLDDVYVEDMASTKHNATNSLTGDDVDASEVARLADGMTGADIVSIFKQIARRKIMEEIRGHESPISHMDIVQGINLFKRQG